MKAIVAMDQKRVIGYNGGIPWKLPADMKWFKEFTMGKTLVMGWNTYQSLPVNLKGRQICVLTKVCPLDSLFQYREPKADNVYFRYPPGTERPWVMDVFEPEDWEDAVVAGGAKTYEILMPCVTELYVTHVAGEHDGDTFMPEFESKFPHNTTIREDKDFRIVCYTK